MKESLLRLTDGDLRFLVSTLSPASADNSRLLRALREDEEILHAMLSDERLFRHLAEDAEAHLRISPRLFFAVLLAKASRDLEGRGYTFERLAGHEAIVFDGEEVLQLLRDAPIADYLVELLVSFVRVQSYSTTVKVREGLWRRYRFSDLDLESLIRYTATLSEDERFLPYKRIADLCLFLTGVFPEYVERRGGTGDRVRGREVVVESGRHFYRAAARHPDAHQTPGGEILATLADKFDLASKPLTHLADRYLGHLKESLFLGRQDG